MTKVGNVNIKLEIEKETVKTKYLSYLGNHKKMHIT